MDLTSDQIEKLKELGINVDAHQVDVLDPKTDITNQVEVLTEEEITDKESASLLQEDIDQITDSPVVNFETSDKKSPSSIFPLLSISGLTILSFGGLILLKGNGQSASSQMPADIQSAPQNTSDVVTPTQVPKSIQHYLLTSQQYFSQAIAQQSQNPESNNSVELLNNSIIAATQAIKEFPNDYRGYQQRASIYQALIESKPDLINQSISDFTTAFKLNPSSAQVSRSLASLYAKKGDASNTIAYLNKTVSLEPTKAQNFYDLAKIQQQAGLISQALNTYNQLLPLISDPNQKTQVEIEKDALEKLAAQNPNQNNLPDYSASLPDPVYTEASEIDSPTIQASTGPNLIIAAPSQDEAIKVSSQTESNSLSGNALLPASQKDLTINNEHVNSTSQVYVTITKGGKNENFQVLSKGDKTFTVGLEAPIEEDIEFKWWIIN